MRATGHEGDQPVIGWRTLDGRLLHRLVGIALPPFAGELPEHPLVFISVGSLKDPESPWIAPKGYTAMDVMTLVPPHPALWETDEGPAHGERYHRNPGYRGIKDEFAERLIDAAERMIPGIREHIVWKEASTPITHERYTLSTGGTSYGIKSALDQVGPNRPGYSTEVAGLYLVGANTQSGHGISGAIKSGVGCASVILERDLAQLPTTKDPDRR